MSLMLVTAVMISIFINIPPILAMFGAESDSIIDAISFAWIILCSALVLFATQRIHDVGFSAAVLLTGFIPYVGLIIVVILLLLPGEEANNRFGDVPESFSLKDLFPRSGDI